MTPWLAIDDISTDSGPLEFLAGSHLVDRWFQPSIGFSPHQKIVPFSNDLRIVSAAV